MELFGLLGVCGIKCAYFFVESLDAIMYLIYEYNNFLGN